MLMTVISLAISLVSIQGSYALSQPDNSSNQTPQNQRVQQENKDATTSPTLPPNVRLPFPVKPIALPAGDNAWAVQVVSRGGFAGSGRGDLTATSDGILTWSGTDGSCSGRLTDEAMQALAKIVLPSNATAYWESKLSGTCGDCYVTTMILQRRGNGGIVRASVVSWDDVSQARVSAEMMTIYEAVMAHSGCKR
jgi:hypothetical protein